MTARTQLAEAIFRTSDGTSNLRDIDAVILFRDEFTAELDSIKNRSPSQETNNEAPGSGYNSNELNFGESHPVIDRIVFQMLAIKWLLEGSIRKFQRYCLTLGDVECSVVQARCKTTFTDSEDVQLFLVLILSVQLARYVVPSSDGVLGRTVGPYLTPEAMAFEAAMKGDIPLVHRLPENKMAVLLEYLRVASSCNLSQLAVAELVPGNLSVFEHADEAILSKAFGLSITLSFLRMKQDFGRMGDLNFDTMNCVQKQIGSLISGCTTIRDAYNNILRHRGNALEQKGFRHLSVNNSDERALLRLISMGCCVSRSRAEWFARAFYQLPSQQRTTLVKGVTSEGIGEEFAVVPVGMRKLFEEALGNTNGDVTALVNALGSLMRFLTHIFETVEVKAESSSKIVTYSVEFALQMVKSYGFRIDPGVLDRLEIPSLSTPKAVLAVASQYGRSDRPRADVSTVSPTTASHSSTTDTNLVSTIHVKTCRKCSNYFTYEHPGGDIKIICGVPGATQYKAISYVWGNVDQIPVQCKACQAVSRIPMEDGNKFEQLMDLVGPNSTVWLDAISIDQGDHEDIATQVAVMGDIYSKAECVSVFLPSSDIQAYWILADVLQKAEAILSQQFLFTQDSGGEAEEKIGRDCQKFHSNLLALSQGQQRWLYWQRAWTFQEWALASDLEIRCADSLSGLTLTNVKTKILSVGFFLARYKLDAGQYASVNIGFSRGYVPEYLTLLKRLFPREDLFLSNEEVDPEKLFMQTLFPHFEIDELLGIRRSRPPGFLSRLSLMLDAFGSKERKARYEADIICYWASMCNIKYEYLKEDSLAVALQKVLAALRSEGVKIFNFQVNTLARLEVDLQFLEYAKAHRISNTTNKAFLPRAPVFAGRTDTAFHISQSLKRENGLVPLGGEDSIEMRRILTTRLPRFVDLDDRDAVALEFMRIIQGARSDGLGGMVYTDIVLSILNVLDGIPRLKLDRYALVVVDIPVTSAIPWKNGEQDGQRYLSAWTICPRNVHSSPLKVAREALNGTLVLATADEGLEAVGYLTLTHGQSGTYLLPADENGDINIDFVFPQRSDVMITSGGSFQKEVMCVSVQYEVE